MHTIMEPRLPAFDLDLPPVGNRRMFAIAFDLDVEKLQSRYTGSYTNAYADVRKILVEEGFEWRQGSVYFGKPERIDAVRCVLAVQRLSRELPWFNKTVRDIRMLRIEDNNDLAPAIGLNP